MKELLFLNRTFLYYWYSFSSSFSSILKINFSFIWFKYLMRMSFRLRVPENTVVDIEVNFKNRFKDGKLKVFPIIMLELYILPWSLPLEIVLLWWSTYVIPKPFSSLFSLNKIFSLNTIVIFSFSSFDFKDL